MAHVWKYVSSISEFYQHQTSKRLVVLYSATWCKPCTELKKWLDKDYQGFPHPVIVIDVEQIGMEPLTSDVNCMPTIDLVENSKVVKKVEGFDKKELSVWLNQWVDDAKNVSTTQEEPMAQTE